MKEVTFEVEYHSSEGAQGRMMIQKSYHPAKLDGKDVYALYAVVDINGRRYNYTVYINRDELEEYSSGILWAPSVFDMINGPDWLKVVITGPSCHYSMDNQDNMNGDSNCGYLDEGFRMYNQIITHPGDSTVASTAMSLRGSRWARTATATP